MKRRHTLSLALAAGLTNGFVTFTGLPYGIYATLAVLAVTTGTYGTAVGLGRQRVLGSILGVVVLVGFYEGLRGLPFPLTIALALGVQRLLGGLLKLQVGYKVGGIIIVMGWLVHQDQLSVWVPMRLLWTEFGVLVGAASLALLWPSSALKNTWEGWAGVLTDLAAQLHKAAADAVDPQPGEGPAPAVRSTIAIRNKMMDSMQASGTSWPACRWWRASMTTCWCMPAPTSRRAGTTSRMRRAPRAAWRRPACKRAFGASLAAMSTTRRCGLPGAGAS